MRASFRMRGFYHRLQGLPLLDALVSLEMLLDDVAEIRPFRDEKLARSWLAQQT